ncbi:glycosyltransferase [Leptolyngbya sp. 'hensonii']|uniref:WecB/TagA/CpsF family glycosyltransferase n=1 Tax=Leptolyngbya sp. 'hensonii' TaxID=1922337 RepID=UPI00094FB4CB|nr:WecB/TagA/CpsF family glycosyltransferase [Leptolyngbya sp. 'hensonii']OLP15819.1 glycosyltransferase [Leptolyngbya sp. 'hensonii']
MNVRLFEQQDISQTPRPISVLGLPVHLMDDYVGWLVSRLQQKLGTQVVTLNAEMTMQADHNPALARIIAQADLVVPDGSGIVFYCWLQGIRLQRSPGIELAESLLCRCAQLDQPGSVFFYGGAPGVVDQVVREWQQRAPGLRIAGCQHGYLAAADQAEFKQTLKSLQPSIILVGLGVPRQEYWITENRSLCPNSIWIGVGGSLDIWAGTKSRAPAWLRNHHMEWVYRLYKEPWRWRRMLALPQFAWRALLYRLTQRGSVIQ